MKKLIFFVPSTHKEIVKSALFDIGVGKIGNYDCCSFETLGVGQFRPLEGSIPFIGSLNSIEIVEEYRVEMVLDDCIVKKAVRTLIKTHPYEEPAYEVYSILTIDNLD